MRKSKKTFCIIIQKNTLYKKKLILILKTTKGENGPKKIDGQCQYDNGHGKGT